VAKQAERIDPGDRRGDVLLLSEGSSRERRSSRRREIRLQCWTIRQERIAVVLARPGRQVLQALVAPLDLV
jgi:hypothetical protein